MIHPPDLFNVIFEPNPSANQSSLQTFIQKRLHEFDRFILIFSEVDKKILTPLYIKSLLTGIEISRNQIFFSHLYPRLADAFISSIEGRFHLCEQENRLIQFWGFTPQQARVFFTKTDIETPKTCLIFINLDRICYQLDLLLEFHTHLLPLLTPWCGYAFFTQNPQSSLFYDWLAVQLGKHFKTFPNEDIESHTHSTTPNWEILSVRIYYRFMNPEYQSRS